MSRSRWVVSGSLMVVVVASVAAVVALTTTPPREQVASDLDQFVRSRPVGPGLKRGALKTVALREPFPEVILSKSASAAEVNGVVADAETVLGVVEGDQARAYPINMMAEPEQEVINDTLGHRPIAVTYCARCRNGIVYDRRVNGKPLIFYVSGALMGDNLVMMDKQTESTWSQVLGQGQEGPLRDRELDLVPSVLTDWKTWKHAHPATTVAILPRMSRAYDRHAKSVEPIIDRLVFGLVLNGSARAWEMSQLQNGIPINDTLDQSAVLIVYDQATATVGGFDRILDHQELNFARIGDKLVDGVTKSEWDITSGRAVAGPRQGDILGRLPGFLVLKSTWVDFHGEASLFHPLGSKPETTP